MTDDGTLFNLPDGWRPIQPRCYHPQLSHAACPSGHPVHLDVDHYDEPTWVHCLIRDVVTCPHDYEDITGAALPGKHRATR